jgi:hypothetical protein
MGLSLLAHASVPLKFWDEAFLVATYLINRLPSKVIHNTRPFKRLFNQDPDYSALHTFGCACWPHLHAYNSRKLQLRSKHCTFLGYSDMHKGYKCLDVSTGHIYISYDVIFDEQVFPFAKLNPNAGARLCAKVTLLHPTLLPFNSRDNTVHDLIPNVPLPTNTTVEFTGENLPENLEESSLNHGIEENSLGIGISETPTSASALGSVHQPELSMPPTRAASDFVLQQLRDPC